MNKIIAGVIVLAVIVSLVALPIDAKGNSVYDKILDRLNGLENRIAYLESLHGVDYQCIDVVCSNTELTCPDGAVLSCENSCSKGKCGGCELSCTGHGLMPGEKGIIIFRMDDVQAWWKEAEAKTLVRNHMGKGVPVTLGVISRDLEAREGVAGSITEKLKEWDANNSDMVDIGIHGYNHSVNYSGLSLEEQVEDINLAKQVFDNLGIEVVSFVAPFDGGNEYTPQAMVDTGLKVWPQGVENPLIDSLNNPMVLEEGIMYGREFSNWSYAEVNGLIDERINEQGYLVITYHQQDFDVADRTGFKNFRLFLRALVKSGKYEFMTAEQYYDYVNIPPGKDVEHHQDDDKGNQKV